MLVYVDANAPTAVFSYLVIVGGLAIVPVIKVATRSELAERWPDLVDVDAGRVTSGRLSLEELG